MSAESAFAQTALPTIAGLILAAGESSRMGADKPLLTYRGRTFLETILFTLHEAGVERVVVVLGHHAEKVRQSIDLTGVEVVVNHDYRLGQTSSLQAGLRVLAANEPAGVVLCLVDHPATSADTLQQLIQNFKSSGHPVVIPRLYGRNGHPVLLGRELFSELQTLDRNAGANSVVRKYRDRTAFVDVTDPGILLDVDDPEAYRQLTAEA